MLHLKAQACSEKRFGAQHCIIVVGSFADKKDAGILIAYADDYGATVLIGKDTHYLLHFRNSSYVDLGPRTYSEQEVRTIVNWELNRLKISPAPRRGTR